jgi:hypothetical protein
MFKSCINHKHLHQYCMCICVCCLRACVRGEGHNKFKFFKVELVLTIRNFLSRLINPFSAKATARVTCVLGPPWIFAQAVSTCCSKSAALSDVNPLLSLCMLPPCSTVVSACVTSRQSNSCCKGVALCTFVHCLNSSTAPSRSSLKQQNSQWVLIRHTSRSSSFI